MPVLSRRTPICPSSNQRGAQGQTPLESSYREEGSLLSLRAFALHYNACGSKVRGFILHTRILHTRDSIPGYSHSCRKRRGTLPVALGSSAVLIRPIRDIRAIRVRVLFLESFIRTTNVSLALEADPRIAIRG